jgi:hypothetical protein
MMKRVHWIIVEQDKAVPLCSRQKPWVGRSTRGGAGWDSCGSQVPFQWPWEWTVLDGRGTDLATQEQGYQVMMGLPNHRLRVFTLNAD